MSEYDALLWLVEEEKRYTTCMKLQNRCKGLWLIEEEKKYTTDINEDLELL